MKFLTNMLLKRGVPPDATNEIVKKTIEKIKTLELPKPKGKLAINELAVYYFYLKSEAIKWIKENNPGATYLAKVKEMGV